MIIDSHIHIGPSVSLGIDVKVEEVVDELKRNGIDLALVMSFPSYAEYDEKVANEMVLKACEENENLFPIYCIGKPFPEEIPEEFVALKWHWVGGVADLKSNYETLKREDLEDFVERVSKPIFFEEEFTFTKIFLERFDVKVVIPHLGLLGGHPADFLREFAENENVYFDTSLASPSQIKEFYEAVPDRLIFGSDKPFGSIHHELKKVAEICDDRVLWKNAKRLFKL